MNIALSPERGAIGYGIIITFSPRVADCATLQDAVNHWMVNDKTKPCSKREQDGTRCDGIRQYQPRQFTDVPKVLPINVSKGISRPLMLAIVPISYQMNWNLTIKCSLCVESPMEVVDT